jgi:hypothetical protein
MVRQRAVGELHQPQLLRDLLPEPQVALLAVQAAAVERGDKAIASRKFLRLATSLIVLQPAVSSCH